MHAGGAAQAERRACAPRAELRRWRGGAGAQVAGRAVRAALACGAQSAHRRSGAGGPNSVARGARGAQAVLAPAAQAARRCWPGGAGWRARGVLRRRPSGAAQAGPAQAVRAQQRWRVGGRTAQGALTCKFFFNFKVRVHH
jgi:hypothetical protein